MCTQNQANKVLENTFLCPALSGFGLPSPISYGIGWAIKGVLTIHSSVRSFLAYLSYLQPLTGGYGQQLTAGQNVGQNTGQKTGTGPGIGADTGTAPVCSYPPAPSYMRLSLSRSTETTSN